MTAPQALARLVLGYLEEEDCISAYDEFIKCSPHLEDFRRDYKSAVMDNFCQKSLKDIFGEYRSYKLYVHSCKHQKLSSNSTALLQNQTRTFEACRSDKDCECRSRPDAAQHRSTRHSMVPQETLAIPAQPLNSAKILPHALLETTQLSDIPGVSSTGRCEDTTQYTHNTEQLRRQPLASAAHEVASQLAMASSLTSSELTDFTDGAGDNTVKTQVIQPRWPTIPVTAKAKATRTGDTSFQDLALAVSSAHSVAGVTSSPIMTNSRISEANIFQVTNELQNYTSSHRITNIENPRQSVCKTQDSCSDVESHGTWCGSESNRNLQSVKNSMANVNTKIKILSDDIIETGNDGRVILKKDGKALRKLSGKPHGLKVHNSTSKAYMHINGNLVYTPQEAYTKDQIMAMPILVVQKQSSVQPEQMSTGTTGTSIATASASMPVLGSADPSLSSLRPITIDIEPGPQPLQDFNDQFVHRAHIPTETVSLEKTSTPSNPRVAKKAASTPRRNSPSHVRVLDFTAPRRILPLNEENERNASLPAMVSSASNKDRVSFTVNQTEDEKVKTDNLNKTRKSNWDADLRAMLPSYEPPSPKKPKNKKRSPFKNRDKVKKPRKSRKKSEDHANEIKSEQLKSELKPDNGGVSSVKEAIHINSGTIKPTINLIHKDRESEIYVDPIPVDTPENDFRPPDVNPPSAAKHNLSDLFLLQTPYKMMVDSLQMETPRFIDPSVFDVPMSDIKIENIPTPNFFNTPNVLSNSEKGVAATPSSYSSRPTDYSSGGSYYRPDEHEFNPLPDLKPSTSPSVSAAAPKVDSAKTPKSKLKKDSAAKSSRPRRQCTLKVSYYDSKTCNEIKGAQGNNRSSLSLSACSEASDSSDCTVTSKTLTPNTSDTGKEKGKGKENKHINKSEHEIVASLEAKRLRMIAHLRKKTPIKRKRKSPGSFPKVKLSAKKFTTKKPKTVGELRQSVTPRKMASCSREKSKKKSLTKDHQSAHLTSTSATSAKSRRKSSTPRKVDKFVAHSMDDSASAETIRHKNEFDVDTEDELPSLRMSYDDGSQDFSLKKDYNTDQEDSEDINQIKAYIETTAKNVEPVYKAEKNKISPHAQDEDVERIKTDLEITSPLKQGVHEFVQRGFDIETAKSIERDLLNIPVTRPPDRASNVKVDIGEQVKTSTTSKIILKTDQSPQRVPAVESPTYSQSSVHSPNHVGSINHSNNFTGDNSTKSNSRVTTLENDIVMVKESFDENSTNYFTFCHDEKSESNKIVMGRIDKDFAIEVNFEDQKLNVFLQEEVVFFDFSPKEMVKNTETMTYNNLHMIKAPSEADNTNSSAESDEETLNAVRSITTKSPHTSVDTDTNLQRQTCIDIFDSTLNSLDTPIKSLTKSGNATPYSEDDRIYDSIGLSKKEGNERNKRNRSPDQTEILDSTSKKNRPDHQTLLQRVDIESFLSKLHGDKE